MNARHSLKREEAKRSRLGAGGSCGAEGAAFATLGISAITAVVLAILAGSVRSDSEPQALSGAERSAIVKYLGSGQLEADARTLACMAQYILEPESTMVSYAGESSRKKSTAVSTNNSSSVPRA